MLQTIPIRPVPAQEFDIVLAKQACTIKLYQKRDALYLDLTANGRAIMTGALCRDRSRLIRHAHLGFAGDLYFVDQEGAKDPLHDALGTRWLLMYEGDA